MTNDNNNIDKINEFNTRSRQENSSNMSLPKSENPIVPIIILLLFSGIVLAKQSIYTSEQIKEYLKLSQELQKDTRAKEEFEELINQDLIRINKILKLSSEDELVLRYFSKVSSDMPLSFLNTFFSETKVARFSKDQLDKLKTTNPERYVFALKVNNLVSKLYSLTAEQRQKINELIPLYPTTQKEYKKYFDRMLEYKNKAFFEQKKIYKQELSLRENREKVRLARQRENALSARANTRKQMLKPKLRA